MFGVFTHESGCLSTSYFIVMQNKDRTLIEQASTNKCDVSKVPSKLQFACDPAIIGVMQWVGPAHIIEK